MEAAAGNSILDFETPFSDFQVLVFGVWFVMPPHS